MIRIFQPVTLQKNQAFMLDKRGSHYLATVLRVKINDEVTLFNGMGGEWQARIIHISKQGITCEPQIFNAENRESPLMIYLFQGISRGEKMDFTIQKAVELGVHKIFPLFSERCNVKFDAERSQKRLSHWQGVLVSACEQSGRNILPTISEPDTFNHSVDKFLDCSRLILTPTGHQKIADLDCANIPQLCIFIGPEGGFSRAEIKLALNRGFQSVSLGPRILRTETAGLAALAMLQSRLGDM